MNNIVCISLSGLGFNAPSSDKSTFRDIMQKPYSKHAIVDVK